MLPSVPRPRTRGTGRRRVRPALVCQRCNMLDALDVGSARYELAGLGLPGRGLR
jgi:hypothetical protein